MAWTSGNGTIAAGQSQDWWFSWGGNGDVGPQLIQAEPLGVSGELSTTAIAEPRQQWASHLSRDRRKQRYQ